MPAVGGGHRPGSAGDAVPPGPAAQSRNPAKAGGEHAQPGNDPTAAAKEICLRLLTGRPRSRAELAEAMRRRAIPEGVATAVLDRYAEVGLVDDVTYAEAAVRSGHTYRGLGRRALRAQLRRKGVDEEVAQQAVAMVGPEEEEQRARDLVRRRLGTTPARDEISLVRRLVGMLARKGYPEGLALRVVRQELRGERWEGPEHHEEL